MEHKVKIIRKKWMTHDVLNLWLERPADYSFTAGQAIDASLEEERFKGKKRPFSFTGLNADEELELMIKVYAEHNGMTLAISKLKEGESMVISDPWDTYKNAGPGVFIAGGTGITPLLAILRQLNADGRVDGSILLFSNKTEKDVFLQNELSRMLGQNFIQILTREEKSSYLHGRINKELLTKQIVDLDKPFYVCGPGKFGKDIREILTEMGVDKTRIDLGF